MLKAEQHGELTEFGPGATGGDLLGTVWDLTYSRLTVLQVDEENQLRAARCVDNHRYHCSPIFEEVKALMSRPSPARTAIVEWINNTESVVAQ